jgi:hypothetical protein
LVDGNVCGAPMQVLLNYVVRQVLFNHAAMHVLFDYAAM